MPFYKSIWVVWYQVITCCTKVFPHWCYYCRDIMPLRKTIPSVLFNLLWECASGLTSIHDLLDQHIPYWCYYERPLLTPLYHKTSFASILSISLYCFHLALTSTGLLICQNSLDTNSRAIYDRKGPLQMRMFLIKHQVLVRRIVQCACKGLRRISFLTLTVDFPLANAAAFLKPVVLMFKVVSGRVSLDTGCQARVVCVKVILPSCI